MMGLEIEMPEAQGDAAPVKSVLNAGCGQQVTRLHAIFRDPGWKVTRLDLEEAVNPDIVGSVTDLGVIPDASFDAVWCSHNLEHLYRHEVGKALSEFRRVLKGDGFALITSPDLEAVAELVVQGQLDEVAYQSPSGPITALDMLFGHSASIEQGGYAMAHHTGFTCERIGGLLVDAGFSEARVIKGTFFDLWALALMPGANKETLLARFKETGLDFEQGE
jgi:SAM-dependent methyltransferase